MNIYDFQAQSSSGKTIQFSEFRDKVIVVVNTATKCGFTPQFYGLQKLHEKYGNKGLVIIGFPCNQFLGQEPLSNDKMESTCEINYGVTFQLTKKVEVNGRSTHPVYKYLKSELGSWFGSRIKWNFTKFLVAADGNPLKRFTPKTKPSDMEEDIKKALGIN